jgi:AraC family transcriptional regulator
MTNLSGPGGIELASIGLDQVSLSETWHEPGSRLPPHAHPTPSLCFVRRGGFRERWRAGAAEHGAGDVIFRAAGDEHENTFRAEGARCLNVAFDPGLLDGLAVGATREVLGGRRVGAILARLSRELSVRTPSALVAQGLVLQALGEAFQRGAPDRGRWLERVRSEIDGRFEKPLSVAGLAAEVGVHPAHLSRAFHRRFGSPVAAYLRQVRVRAAAELLRRSSLTLADVAAGTGFADQSHLTRVFKQVTGLTPGRYRRAGGPPVAV